MAVIRFSSLLAALAWLAVQGASLGASTHADFAQGLAAYDGGDYRTAFEEWRALAEAGAAEQGEAVAQQNLGDLLSRGLGVGRDLVSAYVWLSRAAEQGRRWSAWRRDGIAAQLSPEQRAEAEARLEAWCRAR